MIELLSVVFLCSGVLFIVLASLGFLRMDDVFVRSHVASMAPTLGKIGIFLAAVLVFRDQAVTWKSLLVIFFLFLTGPVSTHLILRAVYSRNSGATLSKGSLEKLN